MARRLTTRKIIATLRGYSTMLNGLANSFESEPRRMRKTIDSVLVQVKFNKKFLDNSKL